MGILGDYLQKPFELGYPRRHQVHVLKQHPATLLGKFLDDGLGGRFLTLPHADVDERLILGRHPPLSAEALDERRRIESREKHEEDGDFIRRFFEGGRHGEGRLGYVIPAHRVADEGCQTGQKPVWSHHPQQDELVDRRQLPVQLARNGQVLCVLGIEPLLPVVAVALDVVSQT